LGIKTVIVGGVSLGLGYLVVVARDGVVGVPMEYVEAVLKHSLPVMAWLARIDEITSFAWRHQARNTFLVVPENAITCDRPLLWWAGVQDMAPSHLHSVHQ
jgi:hypothetical protein